MLEIARKVEQLAPDAFIINFTNPAGIVTEAVARYSNAKIIGLCNVPVNMHHMIAGMLQAPFDEVALRFAGLNHLVWVHQVLCRGEDVTAGVIEQLCEGALTMNNIKEMPWSPAFLRALQAIPCPYHRYYWQTPQMLAEEQEKAQHGRRNACRAGDEGGSRAVRAVCRSAAGAQAGAAEFRGGAYYSEVAVELISAIHNNSGQNLVVNCQNRGAIHGLPDDAVVEVNCVVDAQGAHPGVWRAATADARADAADQSLRAINHRRGGARRSRCRCWRWSATRWSAMSPAPKRCWTKC